MDTVKDTISRSDDIPRMDPPRTTPVVSFSRRDRRLTREGIAGSIMWLDTLTSSCVHSRVVCMRPPQDLCQFMVGEAFGFYLLPGNVTVNAGSD